MQECIDKWQNECLPKCQEIWDSLNYEENKCTLEYLQFLASMDIDISGRLNPEERDIVAVAYQVYQKRKAEAQNRIYSEFENCLKNCKEKFEECCRIS